MPFLNWLLRKPKAEVSPRRKRGAGKKDRDWDQPMFWVTTAGVIVVCVSTAISAAGVWFSWGQMKAAIGQLSVMQQQLRDAHEDAKISSARQSEVDTQQNRLIVANERLSTSASAANRQAMENFVADQRPYIWATDGQESAGFHVGPSPNAGQIIWNWRVQNFGRSPAYKVASTSYIATGDGAFVQTFGEAAAIKRNHREGVPIPPNGTIFGTAVGAPSLSAAEFNELLRKDGGIGIMVKITYSDAYGKPYVTEICYRRLTSGASGHCADHNYVR